MNFINFHQHSESGFLGSLLRVQELVEFAALQGNSACCVSDTLSTYAYIPLTRFCQDAGIRPVYGIELFFHGIGGRGRYPLTLIAADNTGLRNIFHLNSLAHYQFYQNKSFCLKLDFIEKHTAGLYAIAESEILFHIDKPAYLSRYFRRMRGIFGDAFFAEINYTGQKKVSLIKKMLSVLEEFKIDGVAGADARYLRDQNQAFEVLDTLRMKSYPKDERGFPLDVGMDYILRKNDEISRLFSNHPEFIENNKKILDSIRTDYEPWRLNLPMLHQNAGKLKLICEKQLAIRKLSEKYKKRLDQELKIINELDLENEFLFLYDLKTFMQHHRIHFTVTRGNANASLALFLLGLCSIDPIQSKLPCESFLRSAPVPLVEIDIEFPKQTLVTEHLRQKFGDKNFSGISSLRHITYKSLRTVLAKTLHLPKEKQKTLFQLLSQSSASLSLAKLIEKDPAVHNAYERNPEFRDFLGIGRRLEGLPVAAYHHPSDFVIVPHGVESMASIAYDTNGREIAQISTEDLKTCGILRIALRDSKATRLISQKRVKAGISEFENIDIRVRELLSEGDTVGLPMLDYPQTRELLRQVRPSTVSELSDIIALSHPDYRPLREKYVRSNKFASRAFVLPFLAETHGTLLYREQLLLFLMETFSLSYTKAESWIKGLYKNKHIPKAKRDFLTFCQKHLSENEAESLFQFISENPAPILSRSDIFAQARESYEIAFFKVAFPLDFYQSIINLHADSKTAINKFLSDFRLKGYALFPPDINKSAYLFSKCDNGLRAGLGVILHMSAKMAEKIITERKRGLFQGLFDFLNRLPRFPAALVPRLVQAGCFDFEGLNRKSLVDAIPRIYQHIKIERDNEISEDLFQVLKNRKSTSDFISENQQIGKENLYQKLLFEHKATNLYITMHPVETQGEKLQEYQTDSICDAPHLDFAVFSAFLYDLRVFHTRDGRTMAKAVLSDPTGQIEAVFFPKIYRQFVNVIREHEIYLVRGNIRENQMIVESLFLVSVL